jgi:predicted dehydrogenase
MNQPIKVAVIGAGGWGYQHARAYSSRKDTFLCSITGRTEERTRKRAEEFGVPYYLNIGQMIEEQKPDLISICMPGQQTFAPTMEVIKSGIPLLAEKPLAYDMGEAKMLIEEAEKRNLFFAIDFNHRYSIPAIMAKEDIEKGRLGELLFASWRFGHGSGELNHPYLNLIEAQCHGFDLLEYLCGPIRSVMAQMTDKSGKKSFSTFSIALEFQNGGVGTFLGTFDSSEFYPLSQYVELNGTKGRIWMEDSVGKYSFQRVDSRRAEVWNPAFFQDEERSFSHNLDRHLDALIPALLKGEQPPVPAQKGLRALELAYAAIESFETGRRVEILSKIYY